MIEYQVVLGSTCVELEARIVKALRAGWELQGGVAISSTGGMLYAQALIRQSPHDVDRTR